MNRRDFLAVAFLTVATAPALAAGGGLVGAWTGTATHAGDSTAIGLRFVAGTAGLSGALYLPALHVADYALGPVERSGSELRVGPLKLHYDSTSATITGTLPAEIVPVYSIPFRLHPASTPPLDERPEPAAPLATPLWIYDAGAPVWADVAAGDGRFFAADDSGRVHAIDSATGNRLWMHRCGGAIRARPTVAGDAIYVPADDGLLRRLDARTGKELWAVRIDSAITRLPPRDPKSRHDIRASAVTVDGDRLFVGAFGGRVLALDAGSGELRWAAELGGSVLSAPAVAGDRVFVGSFDGTVRALDATAGRELWSFDTRAPVTSTPVTAGDLVVAGSRSYDLFGLEAETGARVWNRYVWFSWIESTPVVAGSEAFVGSSDAAKLFALDVQSGRSLWEADVGGLAWGEPAVSADAVYLGTRGAFGGIEHRASVQARDRSSGRLLWQYRIERPKVPGPYGFGGSGALFGGRFVVAAIDGRVFAFETNEGRGGAR